MDDGLAWVGRVMDTKGDMLLYTRLFRKISHLSYLTSVRSCFSALWSAIFMTGGFDIDEDTLKIRRPISYVVL